MLLLALGADVDGEALPQGLHLGAGVGGGVVGGDVVSVVEVSAGVETEPFGLHLRAPLTLRLWDLPPSVSPSLPSQCAAVRCEELLQGEQLDPTALARIVDEVRLFTPDAPVAARVGRLTATLGGGGLVDRVTTVASWDRRTSGAWLGLRLPWWDLNVDAVAPDVLAPWQLTAARAEIAPLDDIPWHTGLEVAVDATAPLTPVDRAGALPDDAVTRPIVGAIVDTRLPFRLGMLELGPRLEAGLQYGLSDGDGGLFDPRTGGGVGVGGAVGGEGGVALGVLGVRGRVMGSWSSTGHRRGLFSTFYQVERLRALAGSDVAGGVATVGAPGGVGLDARLEASLFDLVAPLVRLHLEPATGQNLLEAGVHVVAADVEVSASVFRRAFGSADELVSPDLARIPLLAVAEASWRFYGPFSISARWFRLPRFDAVRGFVVDDDVVVGVNASGVLSPAF